MGDRLKIGIIGAGAAAERIINASMNHSDIKIHGVYDKDTDRLMQISRNYWLDGYSSYEKILEDPEIDIIYLATPPKFHYPLGVDIFKSDKHFICEKPLANSNREVQKMLSLANVEDRLYAMNFPIIYGPAYKKIKELLDDGYIGKLRRIEFQAYFPEWPRSWQQNSWIKSRNQGGFTREVVTHYVQLMQRLFGDIKNIESYVKYPDDPELSEKSLLAKADIDGVEVLFNCLADVGISEDLNFNIIGSKGAISLKNWEELWLSRKDSRIKKIKLKKNDSLVNLLDNIHRGVIGEECDIVDFKEGAKTHYVIEKLLGN